MKDRFGQPTIIGYSEVEILWIRAALTLPRGERAPAFRDIAAMTGRNLHAVQDKAYKLREEDAELRQRAIDLAKGYGTRSLMVPVRRLSGQGQPTAPSDFRWPSQAAKMAGKAIARMPVRE